MFLFNIQTYVTYDTCIQNIVIYKKINNTFIFQISMNLHVKK